MTITPDPPRPGRRPAAAAVLAPALLAVLAYANSLANGYAIDDEPILAHNAVVHGLGNLRGVLLGPYWPNENALYRPVTLLTLAVQWAVHGDAPAAFHAVNVLLHAGVTALVAVLLLRLGAGPLAAALGAAVFAVHPVHVEAVSNVIGRAEVLAALFYLAACVVYLGAPRPGPGRLAAIAGLLLLSLGSKEMGVTLPGALVVLDAIRSRHERAGPLAILRRNAPAIAVSVLTVAAYLLLRRAVLGAVLGTPPAPNLEGLGTLDRWAMAARLWPEYLRLMLWPADLSAEWGPDTLMVPTWRSPLAWLSLGLMLALIFAAVRAWRRQRWVAGAILWLAATVFPVAQIAFPVGVILAERTLYLPSVCVALLAPALVAAVRPQPRETRQLAGAVAAVLLALGAYRTWTRTPAWASSNALFNSLVDEHPEVWRVDWRAAELLFKAGRGDEGVPYFERALRKTGYGQGLMVQQYTRWMLLAGEPQRAEAVLRQAIRRFPDAPAPRLYLAQARYDQGAFREALALADGAWHTVPHGAGWEGDARHVMALAYDTLGRRDSAAAQNAALLRLPGWRARPEGWFHQARLRALAGDTAGARAALDSTRARLPAGYAAVLRIPPIPSLQHPALLGWVDWAPDGRVGGLREIAPRVRAADPVAEGARPQ